MSESHAQPKSRHVGVKSGRETLRKVKLTIVSVAVALALVVFAITGTLLVHDKERAIGRAHERVARVVNGVEADVNRSLANIDATLIEIADWTAKASVQVVQQAGSPQAKALEMDLPWLTGAALKRDPVLSDVVIMSGDAKVLVSARPDTPRLGLPMPEGFLSTVLAQSSPALMLSAPVVDPHDGRRVLYLARPIRLPGKQLAAVVAEVQLPLLSSLMNPGDSGGQTWVTLEDASGRLLSSFPQLDALTGRTLTPALSPVAATDRPLMMAGRLHREPSIMAVRPTSYPGVILAVGMPLTDALNDGKTERALILAVSLGRLMLIAAAALITWRIATRWEAARVNNAQAKALLESINKALANSLSLVEATLESTTEGVLVVGKDLSIRQYNARFVKAMGVPEPVLAAGDLNQVRALMAAQTQDPDGFGQTLLKAYASSMPETRDEVVFKDGRVFVLHSRPQLLNGQDVGRVWSFQDITAYKVVEGKLQLAASVFTYAREGILITDSAGTILDVNETFTQITGYSRDEALGQNPRMLASGQHEPEFYAAMWNELGTSDHWTGEIWNRRKGGEVYAEALTISAVRDAAGVTRHYVALFADITTMKEQQRQLEHLAHFDALTGLPNRVLLADRLRQAMAQSLRRQQSIGVAYLDLDGFKTVNDQRGHEMGDKLLVVLAQRMKAVLREGDTLARIGGDEFVAALVDLEHAQDFEPVLERLLRAAADPVTVDDVVLQVSVSIGVTTFPQDGADADRLVRHADQAMYQAKQSGRNRYALFDVAQNIAVQAQRESLELIREGLHRREFVLFYQPKANMKTGKVIGAEALIRWQHPERGLLAPAAFLPLIENSPFSVDLGEWVIEEALAQMSVWRADGLDMPVSVNIGARQLQQAGFATRLTELLAGHPEVPAHWLELEVVETSALEDMSLVSALMLACRAIGVRFALDDFGTGYSSLTYLRRLPFELLKIDQSFVRDMIDDPDDLAIVKGVIGLAEAFRRDVIAEGVESVAHGELLLKLGCELAQGYGIARPMPASELPAWTATWQPHAAWRAPV